MSILSRSIMLLLMNLLLLSSAWASEATKVEAVQKQAWFERGGMISPLTPGTQLQEQDTIRTGQGARVVLRLPDQSIIKLGEYAIVKLNVILPPENSKTATFEGDVSIIRGAFRFTSQVATQRNVKIRISKTLTAGIRGTDLWGASQLWGKDLVCLFEGKISVEDAENNAHFMDKHLQYLVVDNKSAELTEGFLEAEKAMVEWMQETELQ